MTSTTAQPTIPPLPQNGLASFLAEHQSFRGAGPIKAAEFAARYCRDISAALSDPATAARLSRIPEQSIRELGNILVSDRQRAIPAIYLAEHGLTRHERNSLVARYGEDTIALIADDPWGMVGRIKGFGFKRSDAVALRMGADPSSIGRIRAAAIHVLSEIEDQGHTWAPRALVEGKAVELLAGAPTSPSLIERAIDAAIADQTLTIRQGWQVGLDKTRAAEYYLAKWMTGRADSPSPHSLKSSDITAAIADHEKRSNKTLNAAQRAAVQSAFLRLASLITGGAGTGKTLTVDFILAVAKRLGISVSLCAPTGKAARRMTEVTGHKAQTIHRLLGVNRGDGEYGFIHGADNPLPSDLVICDEFSMVDIPLAGSLFKAIAPGTSLVMVGDHNQLPSVGPGSVLRDIVAHQPIFTTKLQTVMRQAGPLKENSVTILSGKVIRDDSQRNAWWVIERDTPEEVIGCLTDLMGNRIPRKLGKNVMRDVQVLSPMRVRALGCDSLNKRLQCVMQRALFGEHVPPDDPEDKRPPLIRLHDRVIQTKNDYKLDVMNGEQGTVIAVGDRTLTVDFDGRVIDVPRRSSALQLAYALTIHKSQGSEYPIAIVIAHSSQSFMLHRNLFYTAVTRASQQAIIIGDRKGINRAALKVENEKRRTWLGEVLPAFMQRASGGGE